MKSSIALVGRPNVGKSTFFNYLTRTKDALVADFPGLTRDRQYGEVNFNNTSFIIIDTGGIGVEDVAVDALMSQQTRLAIEEVNIVFFIVDAKEGLNPLDLDIAKYLRKTGKDIYLILNKIDGQNYNVISSDFHKLGFSHTFGISASHGLGVKELLNHIIEILPSDKEEELIDEDAIKVAFIGRPNVGKSTLINSILKEDRLVVYDLPGTTRDSIFIPFCRSNTQYVLIDTAGVRKKSRIKEKVETFSIIKTLQAISNANVCILVIDALEGITDQDLHLLGFIIDSGKSLVIALNKWEVLDEDERQSVKMELGRRLSFVPFVDIKFISAKLGKGINGLFKEINTVYNCALISVSTSKLTNLLESFLKKNPPPLVKGRRIKLRYAHLGGQNPPLIIIHGNQTESIPESYKKYLINSFIKELKLKGTPLKIVFKTSENPYKDKKNILTPRQIKQKKRLMKHVKK